MSGYNNAPHHRREAGRGHHNDNDDNYGSRNQGRHNQRDDDDFRRPQYESEGRDQGRGYGYTPPPGPPPSGAPQGGFQRADYASDADIERMVGAGRGRGRGYAPPSGPPPPSHDQRWRDDDDDFRRPQTYSSQGQGRGQGGYAPPSGPPPSSRGPTGFASQGGLERGDFASDADIERMMASGELEGGPGRTSGRQEHGSGYGGADYERRDGYGRQDESTGPRRTQGYDERANDYGRYDSPSGPPPASGRGYQNEQSSDQGYRHGAGYGGESDRSKQYGAPQTQSRTQYDSSQGPPSDYERGKGNAPAGGFTSSRDSRDESRYGSGYGERPNDRSEPPRRGEAASYYNQQGQDDRYSHLAGLAKEHGDDDPELYRRATQGLHDKIQAQQSRPQRKDDDDDDYKAQAAAYRKAYGGQDDGPMSADAIGAAAAMEAMKQATAGDNTPAGGFKGKSGGPPSKTGMGAQEKEEEETDRAAERGGASGGLQDKLMALAMSHAGKLFDKKNAGSSSGGKSKEEDKAQAMQSAAASAMQLFAKYKTGKLDPSDMQSVMTLAMKMM